MSAAVAEVLRRARDLIATPEKWTKGFSAIDVSNNETDPAGGTAARWCVRGALDRAAIAMRCLASPALRRIAAAAGVEWSHMVWEWNDAPERTHEDVLRAFAKAIAAEEAAP